jgi:hypothetical protein
VRDWWSGARPETAWGALHEAGQLLFERLPPETVYAQIPEPAASVQSNLQTSDPRKVAYLKSLATLEQKQPSQLTNNDQIELARIKRTTDAASDAAHGKVRAYRNLLLSLGVGLSVVVAAMAVIHAIAPSFIDFGAHKGSDAPEVWAIETAGIFGGAIAAVLALARLETATGPYSLTGYQALLRVPMPGALKPVYGLELYAYAIFFGYAQEPLLRMIDRRAATVTEAARDKNEPTPAASGTSG